MGVWWRLIAHDLLEFLKYAKKLGGLPERAQAQLRRIRLNESLQLDFQILNPFNREQVLEGRMVGGVRNIRQGIVRQKLIRLRQLRSLRVQILFKLSLGLRKMLIFISGLQVLQVLHNIRVLSINDEIDLQVKLKFLILEVLLLHVGWNQSIERPEEFLLVSLVHVEEIDPILSHPL